VSPPVIRVLNATKVDQRNTDDVAHRQSDVDGGRKSQR
jgi:hypothetical protein